jgi:cysteinyl-tRNA synthetase
MDEDFNTAGALAQLFELVRAINQARADGCDDGQLQPAQSALRKLAGVLGLRLEETASGSQAAEPFVTLLVELRTELRKQKQWAFSDLIRDRLAELGVTLEDSKEGSAWRFKE